MKKTILAFLLGALLFSAMPIKAAIEEYILYQADYKLMINGQQYSDPDLPLLNYKGFTYAPVRTVFTTAGMNINWNSVSGQAEVNTPETTPNPTPAPKGTIQTEDIVMTESTPEPTAQPTTTPEPVLTPTPQPTLQRTLELVFDNSQCGCGSNGALENSRTIFENGQEYQIVDARCINPKCPLHGQIIGGVRWKVIYK